VLRFYAARLLHRINLRTPGRILGNESWEQTATRLEGENDAAMVRPFVRGAFVGILIGLALIAVTHPAVAAAQACQPADEPTSQRTGPAPMALRAGRWTRPSPARDMAMSASPSRLSSPATVTSFGASPATRSSGDGCFGQMAGKSPMRLGLSTSATFAS
jgi:hypothetical protein